MIVAIGIILYLSIAFIISLFIRVYENKGKCDMDEADKLCISLLWPISISIGSIVGLVWLIFVKVPEVLIRKGKE